MCTIQMPSLNSIIKKNDGNKNNKHRIGIPAQISKKNLND